MHPGQVRKLNLKIEIVDVADRDGVDKENDPDQPEQIPMLHERK